MKNSSLCYIEKDGTYLMLHRTRKEVDENAGKWIGVGGGFEEGETPDECAAREIKEETGLDVKSLSYRGIVTFVSDEWGTEYMHLFTCDSFEGELTDCDEGELEWIEKSKIKDLSLWEGDKVFLDLLEKGEPFFSLKLVYKGEKLVQTELNPRC